MAETESTYVLRLTRRELEVVASCLAEADDVLSSRDEWFSDAYHADWQWFTQRVYELCNGEGGNRHES